MIRASLSPVSRSLSFDLLVCARPTAAESDRARKRFNQNAYPRTREREINTAPGAVALSSRARSQIEGTRERRGYGGQRERRRNSPTAHSRPALRHDRPEYPHPSSVVSGQPITRRSSSRGARRSALSRPPLGVITLRAPLCLLELINGGMPRSGFVPRNIDHSA